MTDFLDRLDRRLQYKRAEEPTLKSRKPVGDCVVIRGEAVPCSSVEKFWRCGVCGSNLVTKPYFGKRLEMRTVCIQDDTHPSDGFLPKSVGRDQMETYQFWYKAMKGEDRMAFVKDRHSEDGRLSDQSRVRRSGRISLGEQREGGGARALPYFTFKVYDEGLAGEAVLQQVSAAIEKFTPGQDTEKPVVLPVYFPANDFTLFASSTYKLAGKEGHPRCIGDGETVGFKLGPHNLMEVGDGEVRVDSLIVDDEVFGRGSSIPCPGRSKDERWTHCEKCRLLLTVDLHIAGLPYIWSLATGDQIFYDQFFTVLRLCADYVNQGLVRFLPEIPLLLRREEGMRARPTEKKEGTYLTWQEMPTLSIEIHPIWKAQIESQRTIVIQPGKETPRIEAPKVTPWFERAKRDLPERPWEPSAVVAFVTRATDEYAMDHPDADNSPAKNTVVVARKQLAAVFGKMMEGDDLDRSIDMAFWYLFGGNLQAISQCAAVWRWSRDDYKEGTTPNPHFEQELLMVLDEANAAADEEEEHPVIDEL